MSLLTLEDFIRSTGASVVYDGIYAKTRERAGIIAPFERSALPSEKRCTYCKALGHGDRCKNCGAGRGV